MYDPKDDIEQDRREERQREHADPCGGCGEYGEDCVCPQQEESEDEDSDDGDSYPGADVPDMPRHVGWDRWAWLLVALTFAGCASTGGDTGAPLKASGSATGQVECLDDVASVELGRGKVLVAQVCGDGWCASGQWVSADGVAEVDCMGAEVVQVAWVGW